jgi:phosphinothricin acetyltransferase
MLIRPVESRDLAPICELTNHYIVNTVVHFAYEPLRVDEFEKMWIDTRDRYPWLSAEVEGRFAGYAKAGSWRSRTAYSWSSEVGIYMRQEFHGRGLGKTLYRALIDECRDRGFHSLIGGITLPNAPSVRLHESLGFAHVGTVKDAGFKRDAWHDVGFWQLLLRSRDHQPA